jgi:hypothetical protein
MQIRTLHAYLGMCIAPTMIFFAATGLLQIYNLHEAHPGYTPAPIIEKLAGVHKDQRFAPGHHDANDSEAPLPSDPAVAQRPVEVSPGDETREPRAATNLLKAFFAFVAIGLILSTGAGIWMALQQSAKRRTHLMLLLIGTLVPVILAALSA